MEFIEKYPNKKWDWYSMSQNKFIHDKHFYIKEIKKDIIERRKIINNKLVKYLYKDIICHLMDFIYYN